LIATSTWRWWWAHRARIGAQIGRYSAERPDRYIDGRQRATLNLAGHTRVVVVDDGQIAGFQAVPVAGHPDFGTYGDQSHFIPPAV
jgi:hypothetical protein